MLSRTNRSAHREVHVDRFRRCWPPVFRIYVVHLPSLPLRGGGRMACAAGSEHGAAPRRVPTRPLVAVADMSGRAVTRLLRMAKVDAVILVLRRRCRPLIHAQSRHAAQPRYELAQAGDARCAAVSLPRGWSRDWCFDGCTGNMGASPCGHRTSTPSTNRSVQNSWTSSSALTSAPAAPYPRSYRRRDGHSHGHVHPLVGQHAKSPYGRAR